MQEYINGWVHTYAWVRVPTSEKEKKSEKVKSVAIVISCSRWECERQKHDTKHKEFFCLSGNCIVLAPCLVLLWSFTFSVNRSPWKQEYIYDKMSSGQKANYTVVTSLAHIISCSQCVQQSRISRERYHQGNGPCTRSPKTFLVAPFACTRYTTVLRL